MPDRNATVRNTPYSNEELDYFKDLLLKKQKETDDEIRELREAIGDMDKNEDDVSSSQDHHPGDLGTNEESKETDYVLIERNLAKIEKINAALDRIANGTYGVCEDTGKKIQKERLEAIPYTRYSVGAKEKYDDPNPGPLK